jgi:hypothetical protein
VYTFGKDGDRPGDFSRPKGARAVNSCWQSEARARGRANSGCPTEYSSRLITRSSWRILTTSGCRCFAT